MLHIISAGAPISPNYREGSTSTSNARKQTTVCDVPHGTTVQYTMGECAIHSIAVCIICTLHSTVSTPATEYAHNKQVTLLYASRARETFFKGYPSGCDS